MKFLARDDMKLGLLCFSLICACSSSPSAPTSPNNAQDAQSDAGSDDTGSDVTTTDAVSGDPLAAQRDVSVVSNSAIARIHHVEPRFGIAEYEWSDPQLRYENAVPFHTVWVPSQGAASIDALAIAGNWTFKVEPDNGGFLWSRADALFGANLYATVVEFNPDEVRVVALEVSPNGTDVTIDFEDPRISLPDANDSNTFAVFHYTAFSAASIPSPGAFLVRTYVGPNGVTVSNTRSDGGIEGILYIVHAMNGAFTTTHEESDSDLEFDLSRTPLDSSLVFYTESIDQTGFNATEFSLGCATQGNTLECGFGPPDNSGNNITISVQ